MDLSPEEAEDIKVIPGDPQRQIYPEVPQNPNEGNGQLVVDNNWQEREQIVQKHREDIINKLKEESKDEFQFKIKNLKGDMIKDNNVQLNKPLTHRQQINNEILQPDNPDVGKKLSTARTSTIGVGNVKYEKTGARDKHENQEGDRYNNKSHEKNRNEMGFIDMARKKLARTVPNSIRQGEKNGTEIRRKIKPGKRPRPRPHRMGRHKQKTTPKPPPKSLFELWQEYRHPFCDKSFIGYGYEFAVLNDVVVNKQLAVGEDGGKDMSKVMEQEESKEFLTLTKGFFLLNCNSTVKYFFDGNNYLNQWIKALLTSATVPFDNLVVNNHFTIALVRFEYVNMYHTMTDWYNTFLVMRFLNHTASETDILFVDAHPKGSLDNVWGDLFHSFKFLSQMKQQTTLYKNLVWGMQGYNSPLSKFYANTLPYVEEFREFFLSQYHIGIDHKLNCQRLNIFFIWRRDYVAHPRNPGGNISRKIKNEDELIQALKQKYPQHNIEGKQLDLLPMKEQLKYISKTDILAGMHGAGLTLALFLPKHSGLVEFYPNYWSDSNEHFKSIARWRSLPYTHWSNFDDENEFENQYTRIPPDMAVDMVEEIINKLCQTSLSQEITQQVTPSSIQAQNIKANNMFQ